MVTAEFITIIGTVVGTGLALGVGLAILIMRSTVRVDADRRAFQAEAAQDRRALQAKMDSFRAEMERLAVHPPAATRPLIFSRSPSPAGAPLSGTC